MSWRGVTNALTPLLSGIADSFTATSRLSRLSAPFCAVFWVAEIGCESSGCVFPHVARGREASPYGDSSSDSLTNGVAFIGTLKSCLWTDGATVRGVVSAPYNGERSTGTRSAYSWASTRKISDTPSAPATQTEQARCGRLPR